MELIILIILVVAGYYGYQWYMGKKYRSIVCSGCGEKNRYPAEQEDINCPNCDYPLMEDGQMLV